MSKTKIKSARAICDIVRRLHRRGKKIVFTNGCFDILHRGHVTYLECARSSGDVLIVGLNTDRSIRMIKGRGRPIQCQRDRAYILSALECVNYVVLFDEPTPYRLIEKIRPDVLVKGRDWPLHQIVGRRIVETRGGKVVRVPILKGRSTSRLIAKLKRL